MLHLIFGMRRLWLCLVEPQPKRGRATTHRGFRSARRLRGGPRGIAFLAKRDTFIKRATIVAVQCPMLTCNELPAVFVVHRVGANGAIRFALGRDVCKWSDESVESYPQESTPTHFGYTAALGDNCEVPAPVGQPSAFWLASFVPPRSVEADVADSRRSSAGWRPNANAAGHSHPRNADAGKERSDEDLTSQAESPQIESRRHTELRVRPWHAHHRNRFTSRWHVIEELATLVQIIESSINFYV